MGQIWVPLISVEKGGEKSAAEELAARARERGMTAKSVDSTGLLSGQSDFGKV